MADFVLDPAVACKWFLPTNQEEGVVEARFLLDRIAKETVTAHVPDLFFYEFSAWAHDRGRAFGLDPETISRAVSALPFRRHPLDETIATAAHIAVGRCNVDFYTAVYLGLSERLLCPFLTSDAEMGARLEQKARIMALKDYVKSTA